VVPCWSKEDEPVAEAKAQFGDDAAENVGVCLYGEDGGNSSDGPGAKLHGIGKVEVQDFGVASKGVGYGTSEKP